MRIEDCMVRAKPKIYMICSDDVFSLPTAVAESIEELSRITGKPEGTLKKGFWRARKGAISKYVEVENDNSTY